MFYDRATIAGPARITSDGYFVADALVARADNIQDYMACELGLTDREATAVVRVFRPASEVFHKDAMSSLAHRPITLDHPSDAVKATNWKQLAVGDVGDEVVRDGEFVRVPIKIMDANAIESVRTNRREFSLGYTATMVAETGIHDGKPYDFVAKDFRYNHLAAVSAARGGAELRIIDERINTPKENTMKIKIGDAEVDATNGEAVRIAVDSLNNKLAALTTDSAALSDANAKLATETGKVAALESQLADANARLAPATLDKMVADRAALVTQAKAIAADLVVDGKTDAEIRRAVVTAKLGDKCPVDDAGVAGAFAVLAVTKDAAPVVNLAPAKFADSTNVVAAIRAARY